MIRPAAPQHSAFLEALIAALSAAVFSATQDCGCADCGTNRYPATAAKPTRASVARVAANARMARADMGFIGRAFKSGCCGAADGIIGWIPFCCQSVPLAYEPPGKMGFSLGSLADRPKSPFLGRMTKPVR